MKYVGTLLAVFVAVQCMPRPDGFGSPMIKAPTGTNGADSAQTGVNVGENGEVEVTQKKTTREETNQEESKGTAQKYEHTGPNGERVSQSSEKNSTHSESETKEETETKKVKFEREGGLSLSEDKTSDTEKTERNTEEGKQSYEQTSGDDPDHQHTLKSESQYRESNETRDRSHDESHDSVNFKPDLSTDSSHSESSSDQHDETKEAQGSSYTEKEDYDKDGKNVRHSGSVTKNNYENKEAKSNSSSTSNEEHKSGNGNGESKDDSKNDTNGNITDVIVSEDSDSNNHTKNQSGQTEEEGQGQINIQNDGTDKNKKPDRTNDQSGNTNKLNNEGESNMEVQSDQENKFDGSEGQINEQNNQIDKSVDTDSQNNVRSGTEVETETGGNTKMEDKNGHKYDIKKSLYHQFHREEKALGLRKEDETASEEDFNDEFIDSSKIRNDFLLSVAQKIHNSKIVSDGRGHPTIVFPYSRFEKSRRTPGGFMNISAPYRTFAQKYGSSPVSSHYANVEYVESKYKHVPAIFGLDDTFYPQNTGNAPNDVKKIQYDTSKSQYGFQNLFKRNSSKEKYNITTLQLSPIEWEKRAQKEAELKVQRNLNRLKMNKRVYKIDPRVKNTFFSRSLDDILKTAHTPAEVSSAMNAITGERKITSSISMKKENELAKSNATTITLTIENENLRHSQNTVIDDPKYNIPETLFDAKNISQVVTNKVELIAANDRFDTGLIPGNVIENALDNAGFKHVEDSFDIANRRKDIGSDYFETPSARVISQRNEVEENPNYVKMEDSYSTSKVESGISSSNYSFETEATRSEKINVDDTKDERNQNLVTDTEKKTKKSSDSLNDTSYSKFISKDTATVHTDLKTKKDTMTVNSESSGNGSAENVGSTASTQELISEVSVYTNSQRSTDYESESKIKYQKNAASNLSTNTFENESEVNVNFNRSTDLGTLKNKTSLSYDDTKLVDFNETSTNVTKTDLSTTAEQTLSKENENNATLIDEQIIDKNNVKVSKDSVVNITKAETNETLENFTSDLFVDLDKRNLKENDTYSIAYNSSNFDSESTKQSENSNIAELAEDSVDDAFVNKTSNAMLVNDSSKFTEGSSNPISPYDSENNATLVNTSNDFENAGKITNTSDIKDDIESLIAGTAQKTEKKVDIENENNVTSNANNRNAFEEINIYNASDILTVKKDTSETTKEVNETVIGEEGGDEESNGRLFARSALEAEEEINVEHSDSITSNNSNHTVSEESNAYNATKVSVINDTSKITIGETPYTEKDNEGLETSRKFISRSTLEIEEETNKENMSNKTSNTYSKNKYEESDVSIESELTSVTKAIGATDTVSINSTDIENVNLNTSDETDTAVLKQEKNVAEVIVDEPVVENIMDSYTTTKLHYDSNINKDTVKDTETVEKSTISGSSVNPTSNPNIIIAETKDSVIDDGPKTNVLLNTTENVDVKTTDSRIDTTKSNESQISNKETKEEPNINSRSSEVKTDAGTSYNTSFTENHTANTTNVNTINATTENRQVGDDDKTDKSVTFVETEVSQSSLNTNNIETIESDTSQATVESNKSSTSAISEKIESDVKTEESETLKSNESENTVKSYTKSGKSKKVLKKDKSETSVKIDESKSEAKTVKADESKVTVETEKFLATVKSDREKEESKSDVVDFTSKSDESRSVSAERLTFRSALEAANTDYSASTSAETTSR